MYIKLYQMFSAKAEKTNLTIHKSPVLAIKYNSGKDEFNRNDIIQLVKEQQKILKKKFPNKEIGMMISVFSNGKWTSSRPFKGLDDPILMTNLQYGELGYKEWVNVKRFNLYQWTVNKKTINKYFPPKEGGKDDKHNDCLIYCIYDAIGKNELPESYNTPWKFKKNIGIKRDDAIDFNLIPSIEKAIKVTINVCGNYEYKSKAKHLRVMTVKLTDGHYELKTHKTDLMKGISYKKQEPIIYKRQNKDSFFAYDGKKEFIMTCQEKYAIDANPRSSNYYLFKCNKNDSLQDVYDKLIYDRDRLYEESKKIIDLHQSRGQPKQVFLKMLHDDIKHIEEPEEINLYEESWLLEASKHALIFGKPCDWTKAYVVDKNSAYSNAMLKITYPTMQGVFMTITNDDIENKYGIYRCIIEKSNNYDIDKLFVFNDDNKYTHYDIEAAQLLQLNINMICDGEPNFLCYTGKTKRGRDLFGKTINRLYEMKNNKVHRAKDVLNCGWGGLCQMNKLKYAVENDISPEDENIVHIEEYDDSKFIKYYSIPGKQFFHKLGRMKPFILSYSRLQMLKDILPVKEIVIRCATDSITTTKPITHLKFGSNIGEYKNEFVGEIKINNCFNDIEKREIN